MRREYDGEQNSVHGEGKPDFGKARGVIDFPQREDGADEQRCIQKGRRGQKTGKKRGNRCGRICGKLECKEV